jgi:AcrR family transcriptional regulator
MPEPLSETPEHHRRAAGRANRARVLEAADEVFSTEGSSASTERVAMVAGVGIGTVFRHFPTKADLLDAVLARRFRRLGEAAERLGREHTPGGALDGFFRLLIHDAQTKVAIGDALRAAGAPASGEAEVAAEQLVSAVTRLVVEAQASGDVRPDVDGQAVYAIMAGTARALAQSRLGDEADARAIAVVLDGLRPPARGTPTPR